MSDLSFTKDASTGQDVADLGNIGTLVVALEFVQAKARGFAGRLRDRFQPADPDLVAVAYAGRMPVEACDPKNTGRAVDGAVVHGGDNAGSGAEEMTLRLSDIRAENDDITGFALFATCADGFSRVEGAVARIYDRTAGRNDHLGNVRFSLEGNHSATLLGLVLKTGTGWRFVRDPQYGSGQTWRDFTRIATNRMPVAG